MQNFALESLNAVERILVSDLQKEPLMLMVVLDWLVNTLVYQMNITYHITISTIVSYCGLHIVTRANQELSLVSVFSFVVIFYNI